MKIAFELIYFIIFSTFLFFFLIPEVKTTSYYIMGAGGIIYLLRWGFRKKNKRITELTDRIYLMMDNLIKLEESNVTELEIEPIEEYINTLFIKYYDGY